MAEEQRTQEQTQENKQLTIKERKIIILDKMLARIESVSELALSLEEIEQVQNLIQINMHLRS